MKKYNLLFLTYLKINYKKMIQIIKNITEYVFDDFIYN